MHIRPYPEFLALCGDTSGSIDQVHVVGDDGVAAVLGDDTDGYDNGKPPAITLGSEEVHVACAPGNFFFYPEGFPDFTVLELDGRVVLVAVGVPFGQGLEGLVVAVLGDEPSGRLGQNFGTGQLMNSTKRNPRPGLTPQEADLADGWGNLDDGEGSPRPVALHVCEAIAD
jgi:hypothetical protein